MAFSAIARARNAFAGRKERDEKLKTFLRNQEAFAADQPEQKEIDKKEFYRFVTAKGERSLTDVNKEFANLTFGQGKLGFEEYVGYRFYEADGPSLEEKRQFLSEGLQWPLISSVCDVTYDALTMDKFVGYGLLSSFGYRVPKTLAMVTIGSRAFPGVERIGTADALRAFVARAPGKLFFKANLGLGSFAAFICDGVEDGKLVTRPNGMLSPEQAMEFIGDRDFLVQDVLQNHAAIRPFAEAVATVRLTNFVIEGDVRTPIIILKIPAGANIADNFWRPGNMLADLDPETGTIRRVIQGEGMDMQTFDTHPASGVPMVGVQLPFWREIIELNREFALAFSPLPFNSLDVAVTDDGPVIVEANTGGSFKLPQLASGRGFLTPDVKAFFGM